MKNELTQSIIDLFITDAYESISKQYVIPFTKVELADYYKYLKQFYYQFLNKHKYPNYSVIISYLLKFLFKYTDLYSIVFDIYYIHKSTPFIEDAKGKGKGKEREDSDNVNAYYYERDTHREDVKVGGYSIYKDEEDDSREDFKEDSLKYSSYKPLFDFFMVLLKKNLHPLPLMRLQNSEITKIFNYIIETIKKSETIVDDSIFIKDLGEFLVSQSINPKTIFNKKFAYLDFSTILNNDVFDFVKKNF